MSTTNILRSRTIMSSNKKGSLVMTFIVAVLAVVLIAYLLIPMVKQSTDEQITSDSFTKTDNYSVGLNITLSHVPLDNSTLRIEHSNSSASLATGSNYTLLSTDTGVLELTNTNVGTYTAYYSYYHTSYMDASGERALFAVVILAGVIGLLYWIFRSTGIIGNE